MTLSGKRLRRILGIFLKQRRCNICGWFGFRFEPFGNKMTFRTDAACPVCGSLERQRAAVLMLKDRISKGQKVLHVAPEALMLPWLVSCSSEYLNIDLYNPAMQKMDLTNLELGNCSRTLVWCSHVLEHILDDRKALQEINRVLVPDGLLVVQVPIRGNVTYENPAITDDAERLEQFLQEDHVRIYGKDLKNRIEQCGFHCEVLSTGDLPTNEQVMYSLRTPLYREIFLCRKTIPK
jgi:SAM-dependent methyltransferase